MTASPLSGHTAVIGTGAWGLTLATLLARADRPAVETLEFTTSNGVLRAHRPDGEILWELRTSDDSPPTVQVVDGGLMLVNGRTWVDQFGRVVAAANFGQGENSVEAGLAPTCDAAWSRLAPITPPPINNDTGDAHNPPLFDSQGNAVVVITHRANYTTVLDVRRSKGASGTWGPFEDVPEPESFATNPEATIDRNDNITIVFKGYTTNNAVRAVRYTPQDGWGPLTDVHVTDMFFQAIETGADRDGNVAAVFDPRNPDSTISAWSATYDVQTQTWGAAASVSATGVDIRLPTVIRNRAGDAMFLIYLVVGGDERGVYAHRWDLDETSWGSAEILPGSHNAGFQIISGGSRLPGVVDRDGNATLLWANNPGPFTVYASRYENRVWQDAVALLPESIFRADMANFGGITLRENTRDVLAVTSRFEDVDVRFLAAHFQPETGWRKVQTPFDTGLLYTTRVRTAWPNRGCAVATVMGIQDGVEQLASLLYDGSDWSTQTLDIPQPYTAFFSDLVSQGDRTVLVFEAEADDGNQGIQAAWLRQRRGECYADCDEDGIVNTLDFICFLNQYNTSDPTADCNGDGIVNTLDFLCFLNVFNGGC